MNATSPMARARVLTARARDAFAGVGGSQAELAALAALALAALTLLAVLWAQTSAGETAPMADPTPGSAPASPEPAPDEGAHDDHPVGDHAVDARAGDIVVHVAGAVLAPGLYELPAGARVADALEAAGGTTAEAALDHLNIAREVSDGEQLLVPDERSLDADIDDGRRPDGKIDVNRASADELEELPGVGPVTAERIIEYREANGPFADPRDLISVPGIGERTMETLAEHIGV